MFASLPYVAVAYGPHEQLQETTLNEWMGSVEL